MAETLTLRATLKGHAGWVTAIATPLDPASDVLLTASRDKSVLVWHLERSESNYGYPKRSLVGHAHYVQDVVISSDGQFALSGSWDGTLRLWDLTTGQTTCRFVGHTKDVLSVAFSVDNRQIVSGSRDKTIRLWNTLGECKYVIAEPEGHTEWVSCVRFSPITASPVIVSGGWDKLVKVWSLANCKLKSNLVGHTGYVNSVTVSPDGSLCASGGKVRDETSEWFFFCVRGGEEARNETRPTTRTTPHVKHAPVIHIHDQPLRAARCRDRPAPASSSFSKERGGPGGAAKKNTAAAGPKKNSFVLSQPRRRDKNTASPFLSHPFLPPCRNALTHNQQPSTKPTLNQHQTNPQPKQPSQDGVAMLWDLAEGKRLYSLDAGDVIHALAFSPNRYWLCAATQQSVKIWDLESKSVVDDLRPDFARAFGRKATPPYCVSLAWSADGATLYAGYTDGAVRVWSVSHGL